MAVIEYDEYKQKLQALEPTLGELEKALGIPKDRQELKDLQAETEQDGFWNNIEHSQKVSQQIKRLEHRIRKYDRLVSEWEDTVTLCEMAQEEDDASLLPEVTAGYDNLEKEISERRLAALLSGEYDANNAILTFHAGAGGTEAQDWTEMLYRMYTRWAERHGYTYQLMDYEAGDEAGIKSATILIEGDNAYGYLKSENGVHRLVRVSPFDANARRQTSFAAVEVMPELNDDSEIEIRPEDIEMQACRSSGAGGQHINKTSSAVRHHPHRGRQRLWLPQERKRRPPAGPGVPLRRQRPAADQLRRRGGHARAERRQRDRDPPRGHRNAGLPLQRRRRPAHQQDLLRRPPDPPAHRHRGVLPDGAQPVPEP